MTSTRRTVTALALLCCINHGAQALAQQPAKTPAAPPPAPAAVPPPAEATARATPAGAAVQLRPVTARLLKLLEGFRFGSYGRIGFSSDLREGSRGRPVNVTSHGPRLEEPPYVELDLGYHLKRPGALSFRVVFTLAFLEDFFHYNGKFEARMAVRNLYLEADHVLTPRLSVWVGSRMYRGDDIYLLDYWPMDNLNTLGGGAKLKLGNTVLALHGGVNRLEDDYQYQTTLVPGPRFGATEVVTMDRQRTIISFKATREFPRKDALSLKASLYGEFHHLPAGTLQNDQREVTNLPADLGWVAGLQLGIWGFGKHSFVNFWARVAGGLGAYGELAIPFGLNTDKQAEDARDVLLALCVNYEKGIFGVMFGAYLRYFEDSDGIEDDPDDGWEYVVAVRPHLFLHQHLHGVFELSYQGRRPDGLHPETQLHETPNVFKVSVMPTLSWDRGTYSRPQIRLVYTLSYLDSAAQIAFPQHDPRRTESVHHFIGAQVEWWFNSSYR